MDQVVEKVRDIHPVISELVEDAEEAASSSEASASLAENSASIASTMAANAEASAQAALTAEPKDYSTFADLPSPSSVPEGTSAHVNNDPNPDNNGRWAVFGGSWVQSADRVTGLEQNAVAWTHQRYGPIEMIESGFIDASGSESPTSTLWFRTGPMPVIGGQSYTISARTAGNARHAWYDESGTFISSFGQDQLQASPITVVAPASARFLRCSTRDENVDQFSVLSVSAYEDIRRLRVILQQHMPDVDAEKVMVDAEALPLVLSRIETTQQEVLEGQNAIANQIDLITDESSPFFVNTWEFTKSHATSTVGVEEADVVGQTAHTLQVESGAGVHFVPNGAMVVEAGDGTVSSYAIKGVSGDVVETFEPLPAGIVRAQAMHEANNGQHLSRLGYIGLADFVVSRPQKYAYRKELVLWQYHPPICARTSLNSDHDIWNIDATERLIDVSLVGNAGNGGWVPGTTNLAKLCRQEGGPSNVTVNAPAKYLSRAYVLKSGAAGDGFTFQIPVQRRYGFAEIAVAGMAETYTSSVDSTTKAVDCKYRVELIGSDDTVFHDQTYDVGETRYLHVEFGGVDSLTLRITQTENKPSSVRLNGVYVYGKSPATPVAPLFQAGDVVAFLGDSWTQFPNALPGETRPLRADGSTADGMCFLSQRIAERAGVTVLNMGKGGTTSAWGRYWVGKIIALDPKPTHCVLSFCINDLNSRSYHNSDTDSPYDFDPENMWAFKTRSAGGIKGSVSNDMWFANMKAICERLLSAGIKPVVLMPPHTGSGSQTGGLQQLFLDKIACGFRNDNEEGGGE